VTGLTGMEKFSHLEDKIYRIIEECRGLKQSNESLENELANLRREFSGVREVNQRLEIQVERLQNEREVIRLKVEAMLDAIAVIDLNPSETAQ
jgi:FtsZ-binding cell division protein ZapB